MLKRIFAALTAVTLIALFTAGCGVPEANDPITVFFATDLHYLSPELTDNGDSFKDAISKGDGKVIEYSDEITDAFFDEVMEKKPDILILGGDLTLNGAVQSHMEFAEKLSAVQASGIQVLVIPGNHDVNNEFAIRYIEGGYEAADALDSEQYFEYYNDFGLAQAEYRDESSLSYMYKASGNLRIIMLDTNTNGKGFVQEGTLDWLADVLSQAEEDKADVITVTHQNLFAHNSMLSFGYQLYNADKLIPILEEYGVKLNLSGHIHIQSIKTENDITEIATSSLEMAPIQYGELIYNGSEAIYSVKKADVSAWAKKLGKADDAYKDFEKYATDYFEYTSRLKVFDRLADASLTDKELDLAAETLAKANTYYFSGETFDTAQFDTGMALINEISEASFYQKYLNAIFENANTEKRNITVSFE